MSKIVLRGGPHCGEEIKTRFPPETYSVPVVPAPLSLEFPRYVDYRRTGNRSVSGATIYDWVGLNWGTWGEVAA